MFKDQSGMFKKIEDIKNKKITIMGLGLNQGGLGISRFFAKAGAKLVVTDLKTEQELKPSLEKLKEFDIRYVLGKHDEKDFIETDLVIQNPAIPDNSKHLQIARKHGIPIKTDLDIFLNFCPSRKIIAISGTKGKSTVSYLIFKIFQNAGVHSILAGNMGISVFNVLEKLTPSTHLILEISSWQLEGIKDHKFRANTTVLTNIIPDHLDRYDSFKNYAEAEKLILKYLDSKDHLIINFDNREVYKETQKISSCIYGFSTQKKVKVGSYLRKNELRYSSGEYDVCFAKISDLLLVGRHHLENILAACTVAFIHRIPIKIITQTISRFSGIPYRLELVGEKNGVKFYNDTCATTPEATLAALQSLPDQPIILIIGGKNKKLVYDKMIEAISKDRRIKKIVLFRHPNYDVTTFLYSRLKNSFESKKIVFANNMAEAIQSADITAKSGDIILLSPAAASFGMFKNEFDRGDQFNNAVKNLL